MIIFHVRGELQSAWLFCHFTALAVLLYTYCFSFVKTRGCSCSPLDPFELIMERARALFYFIEIIHGTGNELHPDSMAVYGEFQAFST